jgi:hypothetical protein
MENHLWEWITHCSALIKDLGFPIFVAVWMLVIHDRSMKKLTSAINSLTRAFDRANITLNDKTKGGD